MVFSILTPGCLTTAQLAIGSRSKAKNERRLSRKVLFLSAAASHEHEHEHNGPVSDQNHSAPRPRPRPPPICYSAFVETDMLAVGTQDGRLSLYEPIPQDSLLPDEEDQRHYWHLASNSVIAPVWKVSIADCSRGFQGKEERKQRPSRRYAFVLHKREYEEAVDVVLWLLADPKDSHAKSRLLSHHFVPEMKTWVAAREKPVLIYYSKGALFLWSLDPMPEHSMPVSVHPMPVSEHSIAEHQTSSAPAYNVPTPNTLACNVPAPNASARQIAAVGSSGDGFEMHIYRDWFICVAGRRLWLLDLAQRDTPSAAVSWELQNECRRLFVPEDECDFEHSSGLVCLMEDPQRRLLQLRINPNSPRPVSERVLENVLLKEGVRVLDVRIGPVTTLVLTTTQLLVLDSVSLQLAGKRAVRHSSQGDSAPEGRIVAAADASGLVVALVGGSTLWIWIPGTHSHDANRDTGALSANASSPSAARKAELRGAIADAETQWNADVALEAHLDRARARLNIDGMNEAELLAYAKMLSIAANRHADEDTDMPWESAAASSVRGDEDDADLQLALRLSLVEH